MDMRASVVAVNFVVELASFSIDAHTTLASPTGRARRVRVAYKRERLSRTRTSLFSICI